MSDKKALTRICRGCGKEWIVAITQAKQQGYVCPVCGWKRKRGGEGNEAHRDMQ